MALVKRSDKKAFFGVTKNTTTTYHRMKGFTQISTSKNPVEYSRKYVDMDFEISDVVGYAPSIAVSFDLHTDDEVHTDIAEIFDKEKTGSATERDVVVVDFTKPVDNKAGHFAAKKRTYSIIPGGEGDGTENYSYTADFKAKSDVTDGTATSTDEWQTLTFTESE